MSESKKSISDYIREYIVATHQRDPKYFATATTAQRNQDFSLFCETKKTEGLNYAGHRPMFTQILGKLSKSLKFDLNKSSMSETKAQKYTVTKGLQSATVTVNPTQQTSTPEPQTQTKQTSTTQNQTQTTAQAPAILHPPLCQCTACKVKRKEIEDIRPDEAGGIVEMIIDLWHSRNPNVKPMTPEETERVGRRLAPILQRHLNGDILMYGLAAVTVGQVFTSRFEQAKKATKDKVEKKRDDANDKSQKRDYSDEPAPKSDTAKAVSTSDIPNRKFFDSKKIREIQDLGEDDKEE